MHRDIPVFNRPIMQKIYKKNQERHLQRLRNIKRSSSITGKSSNNYSLCNRKTAFNEQSKKTHIQKQNVLLFNRMMKIMQRNDPNNQPSNNQNLTMLPNNPRSSVNFSRISSENKTFYQRLQKTKPTISNKKLMQDRMKNLTALKFIGKYPNTNASKNYLRLESRLKSTTNLEPNSCTQKNQNCQIDQQIGDKQMQFYRNQYRRMKQRQENSKVNEQFNSRKQVKSQHYNRQRIVQVQQNQDHDFCPIHDAKPRNNPTSQANRKRQQIVLYEGEQTISNEKMKIFIIRHYNEYQIKAIPVSPFFGVHRPNAYDLIIPQQQGNQFFVYYDYDYKKIASMLVIEEGRLVVEIKEDQQQIGLQQRRGRGQKKRQNIQQNQSEESQLQGLIKQANNIGIKNGVFQVSQQPIRINMGFANYQQDLNQVIQ